MLQRPSVLPEIPAPLRRDAPAWPEASAASARTQAMAGAKGDLTYRPDIDGLRGIAVLLVVAYHLGIPPVRGGFIGVDVFFVISGYLITAVILREKAAGDFSLGRFYMRRIRRILPALLAVLAASAAGSLLLQFPVESKSFAASLLAAMLFASNLYFLATTQYFGGAAESFPLLHTWSLAIEEQFYLGFPLLLMSLRNDTMRRTILVLALASFIICVTLSVAWQEAAFYLIVTRAWELAGGALLAMGLVPRLRQPLHAELCALGGLALILLAGLTYHPALHFPGLWALAPVLGAMAVIHGGSHATTWTSRMLAQAPLLAIGLISYSLYLWHWPLIVFWRDVTGTESDAATKLVLLLASFAAAALSWRFIEQPMRRSRSLASRHPWRIAAAGMAGALAIFTTTTISGGWPQRFSPEQLRLAAYLDYDDAALYRRGDCFIDSHTQRASAFDKRTCLALSATKPNYLLIGDSHAAHLWNGLAQNYPDLNILQATASGCKPVLSGEGETACRTIVTETLKDFVPSASLDGIIIAARWKDSDIAALRRTLEALAPLVPQIYVFGPIPTYDVALPRLLAQAETAGPGSITRALSPSPREADRAMRAALAGHPVKFISFFDLLCASASGCRTETPGKVPLQWDYGHLTREGAELVGAELKARSLFP